MPAGSGVTANFKFEVASLVIGDGTDYDMVSITGLEDQEVKTADLDLIGDGEAPGIDRLAARTVVATFETYSASDGTLQSRIEAVRTAWAPAATQPFYWQLSAAKRYVNGRTRRVEVLEGLRTFGIVTFITEFRVTDPTIRT